MKFLWPDPGINGLLFFLLGGIIVAFEITSRVEQSREESRPETKEDRREKPPQFHLPPSASSAGLFLGFQSFLFGSGVSSFLLKIPTSSSRLILKRYSLDHVT